MTSDTQVMVPGILVALKTSVHGGVEYKRTDKDSDDEGKVVTWETTRLMQDPAEHDRAVKAAGKASRLVSKLCVRTSFGLLCKQADEDQLNAAIAEMRGQVQAWNDASTFTTITCTAIKGRIADNDEEAIRAIVDEARELLATMQEGLTEADVEKIRKAADQARVLSQMMVPESSGWVNTALTAAREAATAINKRAAGLSAEVANSLIEMESEAFASARFEFLEMATRTIEALPSIDLQRGAEIEV